MWGVNHYRRSCFDTVQEEMVVPSVGTSNGDGGTDGHRVGTRATGGAQGRSHQLHSDSDDEDLHNAQWYTEGNEHIGKRA